MRSPTAKKHSAFNSDTFLATIGDGRKMLSVAKKETIFAQGDEADAVFYVQKGKVRLTVVSQAGKEATIAIVSERNFFGEGSLAGQLLRMGSAAAMTDCEILRVDKKTMMDAPAPRTRVLGNVRDLSVGAQHPLRGRPGRPAV